MKNKILQIVFVFIILVILAYCGLFLPPSYYSDRGSAKLQFKDYAGAIKYFTKAIKRATNAEDVSFDFASVYNDRGVARFYLRDYKGAVLDYTKAIELNPANILYLINRWEARFRLNDIKGAAQDAKRIIDMDPKEGIQYITRVIEKAPNYALAYTRRGIAKRELGDYYGAMRDYNEAIKIDPENAFAYYVRGYAGFCLKDYKGAIGDYTKAIELNYPKLKFVYDGRGDALKKLEEYKAAIQDYTKAIEIDPNYAIAYFKRGITKIKIENIKLGCLDLSRAGELGYKEAYEYILKYCQ